MSNLSDKRPFACAAAAGLIALIAIVRIVSSYSHMAQAFDEPCHVGASVELLDKGTYTLDPVHPPLSRIAMGLPLYLAGARYPRLSEPDASDYNVVGDAVLNQSGHYLRTLIIARLGVLPFFGLACVVVFLWASRESGEFAGVAALALFTTMPIILAFSSLAYTDMAAASTQALACWGFSSWLDSHDLRSTLWMGLAVGLALLAKETSCLFLPACFLSLVVLQWLVTRRKTSQMAPDNVSPPRSFYRSLRKTAQEIAVAAAIACVVVWAGYGFSVGHLRESLRISPQSTISFHHLPGPAARIAREIIHYDPIVPAPALLTGLRTAWFLNQGRPASYLLGHIKNGGWWYFFLLGVGVKSPIPFLILVIAGLFSFTSFARDGRWTALAPATCALAILLVTMPVTYDAGVRHVLAVFPLLAIVAGSGCSYLWHMKGGRWAWPRIALIGLVLWQLISTARAGRDTIAYFNELAGNDPSKVLVSGCDFDCGQDMFSLSRELQARHITHASFALWTSADMSAMGLPEFDIPEPYQPVTGWLAISLRAWRFGDFRRHPFRTQYPPDAFDWLNQYVPVARVGKTILLYYIPERVQSTAQ
jgi:4-amino-4-deoxy-L-arabinose transferase-like glycosyltransferase